ncbi:hypothetical protein SRB5_20970 [Streptomyces sp. RB5]|uniref:Putative amidase domain-containing protein n=1 Tax=Streptomyces smaragdinus TaxID=2585196 RepID=A0A7K0CES2_9ACTN|nr:amidase domain-containing protein [Streptomyces smaragdinus]MQY11969.1 hypothetical protein [Streptomyces smaragdinus]
MVTYAGLLNARPEQWTNAAEEYEVLAKYAYQAARDIRDDHAAKVDEHWADATGQLAAERLRTLADQLDSAYDLLFSVKMVLVGLATNMRTAQDTLNGAVTLARNYGIELDHDGYVMFPEVEEHKDIVHEVSELRSQAFKQAYDADRMAHDELAKLRDAVSIVNPDDALALQEEASHVEMSELAATIPTGADPVTVRAWWNSLSAKDRHDLMLAEPVALVNLEGIPEDVKQEMRGEDGKFDRTKTVAFALEHWDKADRIDTGNNCTNFVSEALLAGGMEKKMGFWTGVKGDDDWGIETGTGWNWLDQHLYVGDNRDNAEANQNFMLRHGGEELTRDQVRPGDIVYFEQAGPNEGIARGDTHHAAVVTAVMPDGEIKYTQHSDPHQNISLDGRTPHAVEAEGQQNLRFVRPHPDWY